MLRIKSNSISAFTLTEVVITLLIVSILAGAFIATMAGSRARDNIDRGAQQILDDLTFIRSRAISTNQTHRINFTSTTSWIIQYTDDGGSTWKQTSDVRNMPTDTYLTDVAFSNAGANLQATSRGLFVFLNSATGDPYATVTGLGATRDKIVNVAVGGAVSSEYE